MCHFSCWNNKKHRIPIIYSMAVDLRSQETKNLQKQSKTSIAGPEFLGKMHCTSSGAWDSQGRSQDPGERTKDILITQKKIVEVFPLLQVVEFGKEIVTSLENYNLIKSLFIKKLQVPSSNYFLKFVFEF